MGKAARDESDRTKPPPGWYISEWSRTGGRGIFCCRVDMELGGKTQPEAIRDAWEVYDQEHAIRPPAAVELTAEDLGSVADLDDLIAVLQWVPKVNSLWGPVSDARARELECKLVDLREAQARDLKSRAGGGTC